MQKILLIEDQPKLFFELLTLYGYEVEMAVDGFEGVQKLFSRPDMHVDLVILDIDMPRMDGWGVLKLIRGTPETADLPVIILTCHDAEESLVKGLHRGADLYLVKPISPRRLLAHIESLTRRVSRGPATDGRDMQHPSGDGITALTSRENELLKLIVKGYSNQQIAQTLVISETTVKNHLANIFKKLNVSNRTQAAYLAQKLNLI